MIGKALRKLDYRLAILGVLIILAGTIVAGVNGGWRLASVIGFLLFVFLDGLNCLWTILTHSMNERIHNKLDADDRDRFSDNTKDNPTLR